MGGWVDGALLFALSASTAHNCILRRLLPATRRLSAHSLLYRCLIKELLHTAASTSTTRAEEAAAAADVAAAAAAASAVQAAPAPAAAAAG